MSHFSVSVIVPHDYSNSHVTANDIENCLHRILAPYDEQTEEAEYREFEDRTDEAKPTTRLTPCVSSGTRTALYARSTTASSPTSSISTKM